MTHETQPKDDQPTQKPSKKTYTPRYRRVSTAASSLTIQPRDRLLLQGVYEYGYVSALHLSQLLPASDAPSGIRRRTVGQQQADETKPPRIRREIQRRLQRLFHAGYLQRHAITHNHPIVYSLGPKAVDELSRHTDIDRGKLERAARSRETGERHLAHALMIANFRLALDLAVRHNPAVSLVCWEGENTVRETMDLQDDAGRIKKISVTPDAFFALTYGDRLLHFFVECDQATMSHKRMASKFNAYFHLWRKVTRQDDHDDERWMTQTTAAAIRKVQTRVQAQRPQRDAYLIAGHPVTSFRVLIVTPSEQRADGLRRLSLEVETAHRKKVGMLLFTHEGQYLEEPERIFGSIWQNPRNDELRSLLE